MCKDTYHCISRPINSPSLPPTIPLSTKNPNTDPHGAHRYVGPAIEVSKALPHLTFLSNHLALQPPLSTTPPISTTSSLPYHHPLSTLFQFPILSSFFSLVSPLIIHPLTSPPSSKSATQHKTTDISAYKKNPIHPPTTSLENQKIPNLRMSQTPPNARNDNKNPQHPSSLSSPSTYPLQRGEQPGKCIISMFTSTRYSRYNECLPRIPPGCQKACLLQIQCAEEKKSKLVDLHAREKKSREVGALRPCTDNPEDGGAVAIDDISVKTSLVARRPG